MFRLPLQKSSSLTDNNAAEQEPDSLLSCLTALARHYGRPTNPLSMTSGLPLNEGKLTPELFSLAAARADFSARTVSRPLNKLTNLVLPAVVLLNDGSAVILFRIIDEDLVEILDPDASEDLIMTLSADLRAEATGDVIFVRPRQQGEASEDEGRDVTSRHWFFGSIAPLWPSYLQVIMASALINLFAIAPPLFIMNVYDRVLPNEGFTTLWALAAGIGLAILFDLVFKSVRNALVGHAGRRADVLLASRIFRHVMNINLAARPQRTGEYANHLKNFELVREFFASNTIANMTDFLFIWLFILLIWVIGGPLALVPLTALIIVLVIGLAVQWPMARIVSRTQLEGGYRQSLLLEALLGLETIKSARAEGQFQRRWEAAVAESSLSNEHLRSLSSFAMNLTGTVQQLVTVGMVVYGVYLFSDGELSSGALIASVMLAGRAVAPLAMMANTLTRLQSALQAQRALNEIMGQPEETRAGQKFTDKTIEQGHVVMNAVSFGYGEADVKVLKDISLTISPGERIGIVGRIGSGKTTFGRLITQMHRPTDGSIHIDGLDMSQYHPAEIRQKVAFVAQDATLFHGTVRDNILLGQPNVSDKQLLWAAEVSGVKEFVDRHPKGLDMPVGEAGQLLSMGQRHSVALARAFVGDPHIIFLDEPTGNMDQQSERQFVARLRNALKPHQTLLVATHRSAPLALTQRLIVIEAGSVLHDGPREQVIENLKQKKRSTPPCQPPLAAEKSTHSSAVATASEA